MSLKNIDIWASLIDNEMVKMTILVLSLMALNAFSEPVMLNPRFVKAIHTVETQGRYGPIKGKHGELGPLQISYKCWHDSKVRGSYKQCSCYAYSCEVMQAYLNLYGKQFIKSNDYSSLARIWNGGPDGYENISTRKYWFAVKKELDNPIVFR